MLVSCARAFTLSFARSEVYGGDAKWMWSSARPRFAMR